MEFSGDFDDDKPREECGVFGVLGAESASTLVALGLHALQHRGQETAGIVSFDGRRFYQERSLGRVGDHFTKPEVQNRLPGQSAIGHVRYSTSGAKSLSNAQPIFAELNIGGLAVAHNGNFSNAKTLRRRMIEQGAIFQASTDSELVNHLIAHSRQKGMLSRFIDALRQLEGGYALIALSSKKLIGARDPHGIRPLVLGKLGDAYVLASETCAFDIIGAEYVRDVKNGEVVVIENGCLKSFQPFEDLHLRERLCVFEYIYFSRPDSRIAGRSVYEVRKALGRELALEQQIKADVVVPVPDSGVPSALGYSAHSGTPFEMGIIRNHYVGRTFIEPQQKIRSFGVKLKHNANRAVLEDKSVVLIDDSIVRGTTSGKIISMVRDAGAREVHMLIASPPIRHCDYYGIDLPKKEELVAANYSLEEIRKMIGADSLGYLSIDGLYRALGYEGRNNAEPQLTDHCFTGEYPTQLTDLNNQPEKEPPLLLCEPA